MAYTDFTSSICQISGESPFIISASIPKIISTANIKISASFFPERQMNLLTKSTENYSQPYEYISIAGRRENNLSIGDVIPTSSLPTVPFFNNETIFLLHSRSSNHSVVAVRFSAPGGSENMSNGYLDREVQELSVYNSMNYRNFAVRTQSNLDLKQHTDMSAVATYTKHKTHRNTHYKTTGLGVNAATASVFDNGNINYHIPYHMDQVQWAYRVFFKSSGSWAQEFARTHKMTGSEYYYTASVLNSGTLTASLTNDYASAYGYPSWIQIRAGETWKNRVVKNKNYIIRWQKDVNVDNRIGKSEFYDVISTGSFSTSSEGSYLFKEPPIDYRSEIVEYDVYSGNRIKKLEEAVHHNDFLNPEINNLVGVIDTAEQNKKLNLEQYNKKYVKRVKKQLFPNPKFATFKKTRLREDFIFEAWRDDMDISSSAGHNFNIYNTREVPKYTIPGYVAPYLSTGTITGSIWPLDFYRHPTNWPLSGSDPEQTTDGGWGGMVSGELMAYANLFNSHLRELNPFCAAYTSYFLWNIDHMQLPWTAYQQANSKPFQDTNEIFSLYTNKKYKNYSSVPEFNVSLKINNNNFSILNDVLWTSSFNFLHTGSSLSVLYTDIQKIEDTLNFNINSVVQTRPYKNFYPCQIALECARVMSQSLIFIPAFNDLYFNNKTALTVFIEPWFKPGVLFNSIKAGMAMQYNNGTDSVDTNIVPFNTIFDPGNYFKDRTFSPEFGVVIPITQSLNLERYKNIISNFLEEIRTTFCKNKELNYFRSKLENEFGVFVSGTQYAMDVYLETGKVKKLHHNGFYSWIEGINYFGANSFGGGYYTNIPPWYQMGLESSSLSSYGEYSGLSLVRIIFIPPSTREYRLNEIFSLATLEFRINKISGSAPIPGNIAAMCKITSSFDIFNKKIENEKVYWEINSKWEFPFLAVTGTVMTYSNGLMRFNDEDNAGNPTWHYIGGLWHDFCSVPTEEEGLFLNISDVKYQSGSTFFASASLAEKVGFPNYGRKRVGELNDSKTVSELLCIVPIEKNSKEMFIINPSSLTAKNNLELMKKYILPPKLDHLHYDVKPTMMFCTEIFDIWSRQDLSYIWQNMLPQNGLKHSEQNTIYKVEDEEILKVLKGKEVLFMVFKCKLRAKTNEKENKGYNWPYDYFSLIEMAEIDIITEKQYGE